jgi:signal peptidase I
VELFRALKGFTLHIDFSKGQIILEDRDKGEVMKQNIALKADSEHSFDLAHVDGQVIFKLNGSLILRYLYESPADIEDSSSEKYWISLGISDSRVQIKNIQIWRDILYTDHPSSYAITEPLILSNDDYFTLGDNSPNSQDSRKWGTVPSKNLLGRAFLVFWPAIPFYNWEARWIK